MQPIQVIEQVKLAVDLGLVDPKRSMLDPEYDAIWKSMIGPEWKTDIAMAMYEIAERQVKFIDTFGTYGLN
jgi:hypothetical protein